MRLLPASIKCSVLAIAGFLLFLQGDAWPASTPESRIVEGWKKKLTAIEDTLRSGDNVAAAEACNELAQDTMEKLAEGGSSAQMLSLISAYRAIAATALGNSEEGLWYWRTAQLLYPGIDGVDLHTFGPIPEQLKSTPLRSRFPADSLYWELPKEGKVKEPKLRRHPRAVYPQGMVDQGVEANFTVSFVIDIDGTVKEPELRTRGAQPCIVYALMDALRKWTFTPASINGKPVASVHVHTMIFDIRH